ncbi:PrsW family intramembrane metalloprotease [Neobacillus sp. OS1-2]|uniref:PrsW family intramembrane metalloprotease n=1 Tax=Neobacillus sp. OS1-2 TaxID=3070680 RepID=UPI0027E0D4AE|nr:PrsW family intramembrane metalloprotease [Neobacillus sp. OS1-2]WML41450.1 PrsW family intramembrane metalloprotease [Neobacillus sp. OS1-2]
MECPQCVYANPDGVKFCINCGETFAKDTSQVDENSFFYEFAHYVDMVPKMERSIEPKFQNVFSRVFREHSELEAERLFIVGTALTTPKITEVTDTWPKPWLFARVFVIALLAFAGFYIGVDYFRNINFIPGLLMIGASAVPLTTLIFFWEMNAPQNIAFYRVIFVGFIGGILSMLVALVFFDILKNNINPITIGITEELAKAIMVISFVRYRKYRYILNGLLIGAAVGAGFAAFETAGYALRSLMSGDAQNLYTTILWRGLLAPGGHVAWAALTGAAFCRVQGDQPFRLNMLVKIKFLRVFLLVVVMHALWDTPINGMFPFGQIFLTLASWVAVFLLIRAGLKEIGEKKLLV